ncbi:MAG: carbonic anhydrase [Thermoleophilaceae bacterium]|nr:carbonic anhydrase [Thermoleophilaceae bacterium]
MSETDQLLQNSQSYAAGFDRGDLPMPPARKVAVVACMDARLIPSRVLGLEEGDAHVIRNAGGVVTDDVIRSLAISQLRLGTEEVVLIHHTDCGMVTFADEDLAAQLEESAGRRPEWPAETFGDVEEHLRESIAKVRDSPFVMRKGSVRGFIYDEKTGTLREVS